MTTAAPSSARVAATDGTRHSGAVAVEVLGLSVRPSRATRPTLEGVDLALGPGESVLVVGPSGSGKSTLLDVLSGVVPHSTPATVAGRVLVLGDDPRTQPVARTALRVARLGQDPVTGTCLPRVADEVALPLESRGVPRAEIGPRVRRALVEVGAEHLAGRETGRLSGGELQRVALAASLVAQPELLLLDEPTSMLDPVAAHGVRSVLAARAASGDAGVVLVEQRLGDATWLPRRTVRLDRGRLVADGRTVVGEPAPRTRRVSAGTGAVVVHLADATVLQDGVPVVHVGRLTAREGQVTVLVGHNGSGKSSLLLGMAGLLACRGRREVGPVSYVAQHPEHQLLTRSVADEVAYGLVGRRRRGATHPAGVGVALAATGLDRLARADPFRLSGGEQRRLTLAAASVQRRPVLLLDEPTAGLDRRDGDRVEALCVRAACDGATVVVATHDLDLARALADQVVVLSRGRAVAVGGPELLGDDALLVEAGLAVAR